MEASNRRAWKRALSVCSTLDEFELQCRQFSKILTKFQIWGLFDGFNHDYREQSLAGIVTDRTPESDRVFLTKTYIDAYTLGKELRNGR